MDIVETTGKLVIKRKARLGLVKVIGWVSLVLILPLSVLLTAVNLGAPRDITLTCDRAAAQCTVSPVGFGWKPRTFPLDDLSKLHLEHGVLFVGERGKPGRQQLSNQSDGGDTTRAYHAAVSQAQAFRSGAAPSLTVTYPTGRAGMPWLGVAVSFLFAVTWSWKLFTAPRSFELVLDPAARTVRVGRVLWRRTESTERSFDDIAHVRTWGQHTAHDLVQVALAMKDGGLVSLVDEGSSGVAKADAQALAEKVSAITGAPITGS